MVSFLKLQHGLVLSLVFLPPFFLLLHLLTVCSTEPHHPILTPALPYPLILHLHILVSPLSSGIYFYQTSCWFDLCLSALFSVYNRNHSLILCSVWILTYCGCIERVPVPESFVMLPLRWSLWSCDSALNIVLLSHCLMHQQRDYIYFSNSRYFSFFSGRQFKQNKNVPLSELFIFICFVYLRILYFKNIF